VCKDRRQCAGSIRWTRTVIYSSVGSSKACLANIRNGPRPRHTSASSSLIPRQFSSDGSSFSRYPRLFSHRFPSPLPMYSQRDQRVPNCNPVVSQATALSPISQLEVEAVLSRARVRSPKRGGTRRKRKRKGLCNIEPRLAPAGAKRGASTTNDRGRSSSAPRQSDRRTLTSSRARWRALRAP